MSIMNKIAFSSFCIFHSPSILGFCCCILCLANSKSDAQEAELAKALSFHASFDNGIDADFARGDRQLWNAPAINKRDSATMGLPVGGEVRLEQNAGRFGDALRFIKGRGPMVFYNAEKNIRLPESNWSATISFWLSTDPANELQEGFCDPLQITSKQWDDAAIFVEFEKRAAGIPFRLGVYADKSVWNPTERKFETIPEAERPLASVEKPPFSAGKWTHVAVVLNNFNTSQPNGVAMLFLDGKKAGEISPRNQTFTWDSKKASVMLGLSYIGLMDDLALFDRALKANEIEILYALKGGVRELTCK